jgi:YHS domain-containing protein
MAQDPACGLPVAKEMALEAGRTSEYQGKAYYFDTDGCKRRFDQAPQRYLVSGSGKQVTSSVNLEAYPRVPMDPATQEKDRRQGNFRTPPPPSRAMPRGAPVQKGLAGGLPLGTVMTHPHGPTPAVPQGPPAIQSQPTRPDLPSKP